MLNRPCFVQVEMTSGIAAVVERTLDLWVVEVNNPLVEVRTDRVELGEELE